MHCWADQLLGIFKSSSCFEIVKKRRDSEKGSEKGKKEKSWDENWTAEEKLKMLNTFNIENRSQS